MGTVLYLFFLLPVVLCQSQSEQHCSTDSCTNSMFCLFLERIENMQNELSSIRGQLQEKERELQDTENQLRACREPEINEPVTTKQSMSESNTYGPTEKTTEVTANELQATTERMSEITTHGPTNKTTDVTAQEPHELQAVTERMSELITHGPTNKTTEETGVYAALHLNNYTAVGNVILKVEPRRLSAHGTELWCTTSTALQVYTQDLMPLRTVTLEGVLEANVVTSLPSGWLLVAEKSGLHVLHPNGSRVQSLRTEGMFIDVVSVQGGFYALREDYPTFYNSTVYTYHITNGEFQDSGSITLPHNAQRMSAFNDTVYLIDSMGTHQLYQYSTSGQLLGHHGQQGADVRGTSQPGLLNYPLLCSNDQQGNVLVADWSNFRLQVWSPRDNRWTVTHLAGDSGWPYDAVVSGDASNLWVLEFKGEWPDNWYIVKYTKQ